MGDRPLADDELIARAKHGDTDAYGTLVKEHQTIAFRTAYLVRARPATPRTPEDAFVKAYRALGRFRAGAPFRPWLLAIVANEARNRRRSAGRRERLALRAAEDPLSGGAVPSPEAALLESEQRRELLAAVDDLREDDRLALSCRYFLGLSEEETAALGWRRGTVKSRTSRALERLRERMEVEAQPGSSGPSSLGTELAYPGAAGRLRSRPAPHRRARAPPRRRRRVLVLAFAVLAVASARPWPCRRRARSWSSSAARRDGGARRDAPARPRATENALDLGRPLPTSGRT